MKKIVEKKMAYTIMIRPSVVAEYERLGKRLYISRGHLMSNTLEAALDDVHMLETLGVVRALGGMWKLKELMKERRDAIDRVFEDVV